MVEDRFFDGVGNIAVQGAVARVELTRVVQLNGEAGKAPAQEVDMRLVLPLDALLRMYQALGQIVAQMEDKGVVRKRASPEENVLKQ
uniref:hypothetical protein n=1 Tax=Mariniflexile sp. TaxID=1979402 RepID=UPI0040476C75